MCKQDILTTSLSLSASFRCYTQTSLPQDWECVGSHLLEVLAVSRIIPRTPVLVRRNLCQRLRSFRAPQVRSVPTPCSMFSCLPDIWQGSVSVLGFHVFIHLTNARSLWLPNTWLLPTYCSLCHPDGAKCILLVFLILKILSNFILVHLRSHRSPKICLLSHFVFFLVFNTLTSATSSSCSSRPLTNVDEVSLFPQPSCLHKY